MIEKCSTGIEGLDRLTDGGFLRGSAYIIQGPPGVGKTILANQFCYAHVRAGGRALYMTLLAESSARMLNYVRQLRFFDESVVPGSIQYISGYGVLEREGLAGLLKLVQHELKRYDATAMVLDGTFVAQSAASEQEFRAFIHALQGVAGMTNAVLLMLTHQNRHYTSPEHTMVDGWIEMEDATQGFRSFRTIQVRKQRGASIVPGKHRFRVTADGISVFPRLESALTETGPVAPEAPRTGTGVPELDRLLHGGLPGRSSTLVVGPAGSGKTTLALQFLGQATPEAPGIMLGFYETPARLYARARGMGLDLESMVRAGALEVHWRQPSENIVDEVLAGLLERARAIGARRVAIDGLVVLRDQLVNPSRLPYVLNALGLQLHRLGTTALYTSEIRELGMQNVVMPSDELSAMVDNVLLLNTGRGADGLVRALSVVKLRDSDFDPRNHPFHITGAGIAMRPDPRLASAAGAD